MLKTGNKLQKFWMLPTGRKMLLAGAALRMPVYWMGLRLFGFARMVRWTEASTDKPGLLPEAVRGMAETVSIASHVTMGSENCLVRSLVLRRLLARHGVQTQLKIGVCRDTGRFEAHAWLEREGVPVNDRKDIAQRFAAFDEPLPVTAFRR